MNWEAIGAVGEILGAIAVVVSIVYLSISIRQNSQLLKSAAEGSASQKYESTMHLVGATPENAAIYSRGSQDAESLSAEERTHFFFIIGNAFVQIDYTHQLYLDGNLSKERWEALMNVIRYYISLPGIRYWWRTFGSTVLIGSKSEFGKIVENEVSKYDGTDKINAKR
jgi:hypothetical protein